MIEQINDLLVDDAADRLIEAARSHETTITARLKTVGARHRIRLQGLRFRCKTKESLVRKLKDESRHARGLAINELSEQVGDALRYTFVIPEGRYAATVKAVVADLERKGYRVKRPPNYWPSSRGYRGLNLAMLTKHGYKFELQFHTPRSWETKQKHSHPLYREYQTTGDPLRRVECLREMEEIWRNVPIPPGSIELFREAIE